MLKRPNEPDVVTLSGDQLERIRQVLDVARHQVRLGQHETDDHRVEEALLEAEEAVDAARAHASDAAEAAREHDEASGEAERKRRGWRPVRR